MSQPTTFSTTSRLRPGMGTSLLVIPSPTPPSSSILSTRHHSSTPTLAISNGTSPTELTSAANLFRCRPAQRYGFTKPSTRGTQASIALSTAILEQFYHSRIPTSHLCLSSTLKPCLAPRSQSLISLTTTLPTSRTTFLSTFHTWVQRWQILFPRVKNNATKENDLPDYPVVLQRAHGFSAAATSIEHAVWAAWSAQDAANIASNSLRVLGAYEGSAARLPEFSEQELRDSMTLGQSGEVKDWPWFVDQVKMEGGYRNDAC